MPVLGVWDPKAMADVFQWKLPATCFTLILFVQHTNSATKLERCAIQLSTVYWSTKYVYIHHTVVFIWHIRYHSSAVVAVLLERNSLIAMLYWIRIYNTDVSSYCIHAVCVFLWTWYLRNTLREFLRIWQNTSTWTQELTYLSFCSQGHCGLT